MSRPLSQKVEEPAFGPLEIVHRDEDCVFGTSDHFLIALLRGAISANVAIGWSRALNALHAAQPGKKLGTLSLLERTCPTPVPPESVAQFTDVVQRSREWLGATAVCYAAEGFSCATMRSQLVTIHRESKAAVPYTFTSQIELAASWLAETLGEDQPTRASSLCQYVQELQRVAAGG